MVEQKVGRGASTDEERSGVPTFTSVGCVPRVPRVSKGENDHAASRIPLSFGVRTVESAFLCDAWLILSVGLRSFSPRVRSDPFPFYVFLFNPFHPGLPLPSLCFPSSVEGPSLGMLRHGPDVKRRINSEGWPGCYASS